MGLIKKDTPAVPSTIAPGQAATAMDPIQRTENGTDAAIARLQKPTEVKSFAPKVRDFDAEARGKTRCVMIGDAFKSPAIAGMKFNTMDEFLELCRKAADFGVAYSFNELDQK